MSVEFIDHSDEVRKELKAAVLRALDRCGMAAEGYAKDLAPSPGKGGTGQLRNDISHEVDEAKQAAYVGVRVEHGVYLELGTGKYYPGGRQEPWAYQDANGQWHMTFGQRAQPFIKPAVADHKRTYINIARDELKGGG